MGTSTLKKKKKKKKDQIFGKNKKILVLQNNFNLKNADVTDFFGQENPLFILRSKETGK